MTERPTGTVTFLFTDIEQSTRRWEEDPRAMRAALAKHDATLSTVIEASGGWLFKHTGDGIIAAFCHARAAIEAAVTAQRRLELPVRMAIATGEVELRNQDYYGPALNLAARAMAAGHAGQVLVTAPTAAMVTDVDLLDLGEHRLRDLSRPQRLYQLRADGLVDHFAPLRTLDVTSGNLPVPATSILGRADEIAAIAALLDSHRLVTLTGVGGVGKTRLALQVATDCAPRFANGAWLVELSGVGDADALPHALAAVLGIMQQPEQTVEASIVAALAARRLLVVLDNCEHLIEAAAAIAQQIMRHTSNVRILATSREALMIEGERIWPVPSLRCRDGAASPAVELFVQRARAIVPDFEVTNDVEAVTEICRRLDGIPLAIELAAARIRSLSPAEIRDRLSERFRFLTGASRRTVERHQTLRQTVQWSFDLLSPGERALVSRASVFAGGFDLEAAEEVAAGPEFRRDETLDLLDSVVRKSLVIVERTGRIVRYGMLETIRQFAEEQLGATGTGDDVRLRHARYFAKEADRYFEIWRSPQERLAYEWLDRELDNLRIAFRWSVEQEHIDLAARLASDIGDLARYRLRQEPANWAAEIVGAARAVRHPRLAILLTWAASNAWAFGRLNEAKQFGEEAISLAGNPGFEPFVWAFTDLAQVAMYEGDYDRAIALVERGAADPADRHDRVCAALVAIYQAAARRYDEAIVRAANALPLVEATGFPTAIAWGYYAKGVACRERDPATAIAALERSLSVARDAGNRLAEHVGLTELAMLQARHGDVDMALRHFDDMLLGRRGSSDIIYAAHGLGGLAILFARLHEFDVAATLRGTVSGAIGAGTFMVGLAEAMQEAESALGNAAFRAASARGAAMSLQQATEFAQEHIARALRSGRAPG